MINVLVTCGGGFQGLTLYKSLKEISGLSLHLFDSNPENISRHFFDYFSTSKQVVNKNRYINHLIDYTIKNKIKFIFPATTYDLEILSEIKNQFRELYECNIVVPDLNFIKMFGNKKTASVFFENCGFPVQKLLLREEIKKYPVLAKPNIGWGGKNVSIIYNKNQLKGLDDKKYHFVEYFKNFQEFSIDFSINQHGNCSSIIVRKRNVVSSGFSVITDAKDIYRVKYLKYLELIKKIFSDTNKTGIYNIQFLMSDTENIYFSDLNSRIGTSSVLSNYKGRSILNSFFNNSNDQVSNVKAVRFLEEKFYPIIKTEKIKAVVFDLDDTLISNKTFILSRAIIFYNTIQLHKVIDLREFKILILGLLNEGMAPILIDKLKTILKLKTDKQTLVNTYRNCYPLDLHFYKDVISTIKFLKKKKYKLYILTDGIQKTQKIKIDLLSDLMADFDEIFFTSDLNLEKPDSKCFSMISEKTNFKMNELVMVGDNEFRDINGALKAGFAYGFHITRKDGIVSNSLYSSKLSHKKSFQIDSLHSLKFIL